jgi:hypothetical protein
MGAEPLGTGHAGLSFRFMLLWFYYADLAAAEAFYGEALGLGPCICDQVRRAGARLRHSHAQRDRGPM